MTWVSKYILLISVQGNVMLACCQAHADWHQVFLNKMAPTVCTQRAYLVCIIQWYCRGRVMVQVNLHKI